MNKIVIVFDSFKGCMSSSDACRAAAEGVHDVLGDAKADCIVAADGGEGMSEAVRLNGIGREVSCRATDPLGRPIEAAYTYDVATRSAYIDFACAAGITLLTQEEKNPMNASTFGFGEVIADAVDRGARHLYLGLGGSATNDAGFGALQALGAKFLDEYGEIIPKPFSGKDLCKVSSFDLTDLYNKLKYTKIHLLCDVNNPFVGETGAVAVYAMQKGADAAMLSVLEKGMNRVACAMKKCGFIDVFDLPGAGAAGGAGGGFAALAGAEILPGARTLLRLAGMDRRLDGCSLVITGEGKCDRQTLHGKLPATVKDMAVRRNIPTVIFAGVTEDVVALEAGGFEAVVSINNPSCWCQNSSMKSKILASEDPLDRAVAMRRLRRAVAAYLHHRRTLKNP